MIQSEIKLRDLRGSYGGDVSQGDQFQTCHLRVRLESNASQQRLCGGLPASPRAGMSFHYQDCLGILVEHK